MRCAPLRSPQTLGNSSKVQGRFRALKTENSRIVLQPLDRATPR